MTWVAGTPFSPEHRAKLSLALKGVPKSPEHRAKIAKAQVGSKSYLWRGGRFLHHGYVYRNVGKDHPMANKNGCALEHRLVMAEVLGRLLATDETVHHIDGDKENNQPENLQLRKGRHGKGVSFMCGDCGSINVLSIELPEIS